MGHRLFDARPLFSEGASKGTDRVKYDRFFFPDRAVQATLFAPIMFAPLPVLAFRRVPLHAPPAGGTAAAGTTEADEAAVAADGLYPAPDCLLQIPACTRYRLVLVASGSVLGCDPQQLVLKRTILSGFPVRVKRRWAMVKHMFYNPEDIDYFKTIDVSTKTGLQGEEGRGALISRSAHHPQPRMHTRRPLHHREHHHVGGHARPHEVPVQQGHQAERYSHDDAVQACVPTVG